MVHRSGFYVKDGKIVQRVVSINWNLGFTKEAKQCYIQRITEALGMEGVVDVTSASPVPMTRDLSPIFVRMQDGSGLSVEDFLQVLSQKCDNLFELEGVTDFIYISNLSEQNKQAARCYSCYIDVFHNPDKGYGNSQALSLALFRLMEEQGVTDKLVTLQEFVDWRRTVEMITEEVVSNE